MLEERFDTGLEYVYFVFRRDNYRNLWVIYDIVLRSVGSVMKLL